MSGKKNKVRRKSGFLTGLMIVSTGLIAGFQGFELAVSEKNGQQSGSRQSNAAGNERSDRAVGRQVSALDQLVTASLEQSPSRADSRGLAKLIQSTEFAAIANDQSPAAPIVNRALKGDREVQQVSSNTSLISNELDNLVEETSRNPQSENSGFGKIAAKQQDTEQRQEPSVKPELAQPPVDKVSNNAEIAYADSADIALFAADMPLPAKLTFNPANSSPALFPANRGNRPHRSPLVPRKFVSGKAFGGLAERAFQKRERRCMTTALYFEARSEPESGQIAVGQVVMNRVRSPDYPDTICGVVYQGSHRRTGCQFSFTCDGKADKPNSTKQWERSKRLSNQVLEGKVWLNSIGNATHYHANYVKPRWRKKMARLKQIGRHIFYKSPNISVTDTYQRYISGKRS